MRWRSQLCAAAGFGLTAAFVELTFEGWGEHLFWGSNAAFFRPAALMAGATTTACLAGSWAGRAVGGTRGASKAGAAWAGRLGAATPIVLWAIGGLPLAAGQAASWAAATASAVLVFGVAMAALRSTSQDRQARWGALAYGVPVAAALAFVAELFRASRIGHGAPWSSVIVGWAVASAVAIAVIGALRLGPLAAGLGLAGLCAGAALSSPEPDLSSRRVVASPQALHPSVVVLLTVDTLRRDALGVYAGPGPTPAIDALAQDSVVFDRAYSTAPFTLPSLTSIHLGLTPWAHGVRRIDERTPANAAALAPALAAAGYETAAIGFNYFPTLGGQGRALRLGFDRYHFFPLSHSPRTPSLGWLRRIRPSWLGMDADTGELADHALRWIEHHPAGDFFLWLHFFDPHHPYNPPEAFDSAPPLPAALKGLTREQVLEQMEAIKDRPKIAASAEARAEMGQWIRQIYQDEVRYVDAAVGRVLDGLREAGLYQEALVVFTSDHGEEFLEHGTLTHGKNLYDPLLRAPLMIKLPGAESADRVDSLASTVAIAPTILDLTGTAFDREDFSAESLRGQWEQRSPERGETPVFLTGISRLEQREGVVFEHEGRLHKYVRWLESGREEIYDLNSDPDEFDDLASRRGELVEAARAMIADHALAENRRARRRGLAAEPEKELTERQRTILRSLGYLQ